MALKGSRVTEEHRGALGFTLVELLAVIAIMSLILLVAIPSFINLLPMRRFDATVRQLGTDITLQRLRAVASGQPTSIVFDAATQSYTLQPFNLQRELPPEAFVTAFPAIAFNSRGVLDGGSALTVSFMRADGAARYVEVSVAGRVKLGP